MPGWTGSKDHGPREYTEPERQLVVRLILDRHIGRENKILMATFCDYDELAILGDTWSRGRKVRQIKSDMDGVEFLLCDEVGEAGFFVVQEADEGDATTRSLASRVRTTQQRVERRIEYARSNLPRRQPFLFEGADAGVVN